MMCTRLYNIEPIGIGTPYVEGLHSYIKRLSEAHFVTPGTLMKYEIYPKYPDYYYYIAFLNYERKYLPISIDFINETIDVLETKTGNQDIRNTTISKYGWKVFSEFRYRKYAAWCPICFEESKISGQEVYEPLIWCFKDIMICNKHSVNLVEICPYCGKHIKRITSRSRAGYCYHCQTWLGLNNYNDTSLVERQDMTVYKIINDMIAQLPDVLTPTLVEYKTSVKQTRAIKKPDSKELIQAGHPGRKRTITMEQVEEAIKLLLQSNELISYKRVAEKAGISIRAINNRNDLQELIKRYKNLTQTG
jgi:hypothetical protein